MDAGSSTAGPLRIVICPWLAFGHLLPYLELAERLASRSHRVAFVSTPRNLARLPPPASPCSVDLAFDSLAAPFADFLAAACADDGRRPHWIIADCFHHWAAAALDHKVPCAVLLPTAAMLAAAPRQQPLGSKPVEAAAAASVLGQAAAAVRLAVPSYERDDVAPAYADDCASGMSIAQRWFLAKEMHGLGHPELRGVGQTFPLVEALLGKPVVPLGLLPPSADGGRRRAAGSSEDHVTLRWLEEQPPDSVVYIALGSEVPLSIEQVHRLALGLELAGTRFLWALRKPAGAVVSNNDDDTLPRLPGLHPQPRAGLLFGHPLVMLPIFGDQGPNARQMEAKKVGLQVARDDDDGSFDRHGVAAAVRAVMVDGEARRDLWRMPSRCRRSWPTRNAMRDTSTDLFNNSDRICKQLMISLPPRTPAETERAFTNKM
ncbi:hypothetical protein ZWY2020_058887 [Hordeum vulgare]|nr:hypothetical protein ZWY2020_058887 [Hordeum vulgare]